MIEAAESEPDPLAGVPPDAPPSVQAAAYEEAVARVEGVADRLDDIDAPDEIADAHDDFVAALRGVVDARSGIVSALERGDEAEAIAITEGNLPPEVIELATSARAEFDEQGYELGLDSSLAP